MAVHAQAEAIDVDLRRNDGPMPADIELIVRRDDPLVVDLERRLQQGRPRALENAALFAGMPWDLPLAIRRGVDRSLLSQAGPPFRPVARPAWLSKNRLESGWRSNLLSMLGLFGT
jgi:hypothetical protein